VVQIHSPRPSLLEQELTANKGIKEHLAPHQEVSGSNPFVPIIISPLNSYRYARFVAVFTAAPTIRDLPQVWFTMIRRESRAAGASTRRQCTPAVPPPNGTP
jgi:hypothetical protein